MIEDAKLVPLVAHADDRGYLIEILRQTDEHFTRFGQLYMVGNFSKGVIRAWHKHNVLWDWFFISHGAAKFALKDDRKDRESFGRIENFVISQRNPAVLVVPPGVYHGWMSLEDDTQLISTASEVYNRENPDEVRVPPDAFDYAWEVEGR